MVGSDHWYGSARMRLCFEPPSNLVRKWRVYLSRKGGFRCWLGVNLVPANGGCFTCYGTSTTVLAARYLNTDPASGGTVRFRCAPSKGGTSGRSLSGVVVFAGRSLELCGTAVSVQILPAKLLPRAGSPARSTWWRHESPCALTNQGTDHHVYHRISR